MIRIFLDESGDLGFGERSSRWFVLTIAMTGDYRRIEKCVKRVHRGLKKKFRKVGELHAYHCSPITRKRVLHLLAEADDLKIFCIVLNKEKVYVDLQNQKNFLYNYTANILLDRMHAKGIMKGKEKALIVIDQRETNKFLKRNFEKYLSDNLSEKVGGDFEISIRPSYSEKCLQAVDFVSWAIFRKYEQGDYEYYQIIKDKVFEENMLFP